MSIKDIESLFEEEQTPICDDVWLLSLLMLMFINSDKKNNTVINVYINEKKVGE